ncbi:MAG: RluA family pseudouridine synthase [Acidobacteriota bacterium]
MDSARDRIYAFRATTDDQGMRLDRFLVRQLPFHSRTELSRWIRSGAVTLAGHSVRPSHQLQAGDIIRVQPPEILPSRLIAEPMDLDILYEDEHILALVKPAGLVVHPGAGVRSGTLVHGLLAREGSWSTIGGQIRPGIVHRLDRDTSGVLVVARTDAAHRHLAAQFKNRQVKKEYLALVFGHPHPGSGWIDAPIARHRIHRNLMAVRDAGRPARTHYAILRSTADLCLLNLRPLSGRTHQIRVHLSAMGHPIVGDPLYGGVQRLEQLPEGSSRTAASQFGRLALHASRLGFTHPVTGHPLCFEAPMPSDVAHLIAAIFPSEA